MWTSDRSRRRAAQDPLAGVGEVTLGQIPAGVYLEGERRWTQVYGPGGYCWRPALGEQVLVLKAGGEGEQPCLVGRRQQEELEPGQVRISAGQAKIDLHPDGTVALSGAVKINGTALTQLVEQIVKDMLEGG